jgi:membrane protease YdiL (CAAX protease family)
MSDSYNSNRPVTTKARAPKTWDFMETLFVALVAYAVYEGMGSLAYDALVAIYDSAPRSSALLRTLDEAATLLACGATIAVLWAATRMAGREFTEYLALNWPNRNELLLALAVMAVLVAVQFGVWPNKFSVNPSLVAGGAGELFVLLVVRWLAGPIMEEFVFRGFMFRGWSESFLGPAGAILLTSALFAVYHQYGWLERLWVFLGGLVLCFLRWRSNSTWLAVMAHSAVNIFLRFLAASYA